MEWKYGIEFVHVDAVSLSAHIYPIGKDLSLYYLKNHYSLTFKPRSYPIQKLEGTRFGVIGTCKN